MSYCGKIFIIIGYLLLGLVFGFVVVILSLLFNII